MKYEIAPKSTEIEANWDDARFYCFSLNVNGKSGWRLPTIVELCEIHKSDNDFYGCYWSSTENGDNAAWCQGFHRGSQYSHNKVIGNFYVRAVRSI